MGLINALINEITAHHKQTNGKCGITIITLSNMLKIPINQLRPYLDELRKEGLIKVREGINNNLIFLRIKK